MEGARSSWVTGIVGGTEWKERSGEDRWKGEGKT